MKGVKHTTWIIESACAIFLHGSLARFYIRFFEKLPIPSPQKNSGLVRPYLQHTKVLKDGNASYVRK